MGNGQKDSKGLFLYGIVPSDVEPQSGVEGVGSPAGQISAIRQDDLAALVSEVPLDQPVGRPDDLKAYQYLLDETAAVAPVLPVRFGTVMGTPDAVAEWLGNGHDEFTEALDNVDGRVQYNVRGRFDEEAFIGAFLAEDRSAAQLADRVRGKEEAAVRQDRIQLGQLIAQAVEQRQQAHNRELLEAVNQHAVASAILPPSTEMDAVDVAALVEAEKVDGFVQAVEQFAGERQDIHMRLLGPLAPYDFVVQPG